MKPRAKLPPQMLRVLQAIAAWRTLDEIAQRTGDPQASVSAELRHLRKRKFGGHTVLKRIRRSDRALQGHVWEYRCELS